jgi:Tol biopolymer transport system component
MRAALALGIGATLLGLLPSAASGKQRGHAVVWFTGNDAPAWSPDGSQIAFTAFRSGRRGEIYLMRPNGTKSHNLTNNPAYEDLAVWSPDSKRIAFTSNRDGNDEVYVMNANGSRQTRLTRATGADYSASWSPDGRKIAFWSNRDGNNEIYVMDADGSNQTRLTTNPASDYSPSWGPDGKIVFVSNREDASRRTRLFVMNADGSGQRQLTGLDANWSESRPEWSPDGTKIGFVSDRDFPVDNTEIYEMNPDGTGELRITHSPQHDDWPTWSPDGAKIAFSHGALLSPEIYDMNIDGSGARLLSRKGLVLETRFLHVAQPVAGRLFAVTLGVTTGTGAAVKRARTSCSARVGTKTLRVVTRTFGASRAHCVWLVPGSATGKPLYLSISARAGTYVLTETAKTFVR